MNNYSVVKEYIRSYSSNYYLLKKNNVLYAYDYEHHLLSKTKKILNMNRIFISKNEIVYIASYPKKSFYMWDVLNNKFTRIEYTKLLDPEIKKFLEVDDRIYIHFSGSQKGQAIEYHLAYIDNETLEMVYDENELSTDTITRLYSDHKNIYYLNFDSRLMKYKLFVMLNGEVQEKLTMYGLYDHLFKISNTRRYALLATTLTSINMMNSSGKITIIDLNHYQVIDEIKINHMGLYRSIVNFFHYNHKEYIIYQANPKKCTFKNEKWHTYIYDIEEKKVIFEASFSFAMNYIKFKNLLTVETNYSGKKTIFYKIEDESKQDLQWILDNILTKKFLRSCK